MKRLIKGYRKRKVQKFDFSMMTNCLVVHCNSQSPGLMKSDASPFISASKPFFSSRIFQSEILTRLIFRSLLDELRDLTLFEIGSRFNDTIFVDCESGFDDDICFDGVSSFDCDNDCDGDEIDQVTSSMGLEVFNKDLQITDSPSTNTCRVVLGQYSASMIGESIYLTHKVMSHKLMIIYCSF